MNAVNRGIYEKNSYGYSRPATAVINVNDPGGEIKIGTIQVERTDKSWDRYIIFQGNDFNLRLDKNLSSSGVAKALGVFKNDFNTKVRVELFCTYKKR